MEEIKVLCSHCGAVIADNDFGTVNGQIVCSECISSYCCICDRCGAAIFDSDSHGDEYINLCHSCFSGYYCRCESCDSIVSVDDCYNLDGYDYCCDCYHDEVDNNRSVHDYNYKPEPIFYGNAKGYFGVELEIDGAGNDSDKADELLRIANEDNEHVIIKSDSSLEAGCEIVTHPMSLDYHKNFCWEDIMLKAVRLGYRSHQTSTCGLHIHVNRTSLGELHEQQEEVISRILFFVEHHWNELLKFSRRSEVAINRWAARYGYESSPKAILDKAKKGSYGRYAAVNLCNYHTIEFRLFRGTLKYNTLIAALELVNAICDLATSASDEELQKLSWSDFVANLTETELIHYLKERNLYVNDKVEETEDL